MINKSQAKYLLTTYANLFNILLADNEKYTLIRNIFNALNAVIDGTRSNPTIEKIMKDLRCVDFRYQFTRVLTKDEEYIKDLFNDLVIDLFDDNLEIKTSHVLPSLQIQQNKREDIVDSNLAGYEFKRTLQHFLENDSKESKEKLISSARELYKSVRNEKGNDTDKIIARLNNILSPLLKDIQINTQQKIALQRLIKNLGKTAASISRIDAVAIKIEIGAEETKDVTAFHAINQACYNFLIPNSKKKNLKKITLSFLDELEKLQKASALIEAKCSKNSFFFKKENSEHISERKNVIESKFKSFSEKIIFTVNKENIPLKDPQQLIDLIDQLTEKECDQLVNELMKDINKITIQDRNVLKTHSINDKWIFNWFIKLVQVVQEAFNVKTSSEELLEDIASTSEFFGKNNLP